MLGCLPCELISSRGISQTCNIYGVFERWLVSQNLSFDLCFATWPIDVVKHFHMFRAHGGFGFLGACPEYLFLDSSVFRWMNLIFLVVHNENVHSFFPSFCSYFLKQKFYQNIELENPYGRKTRPCWPCTLNRLNYIHLKLRWKR